MSIVTTTDVFCDGKDCGGWVSGVCGEHRRRLAAREIAKVKGWVYKVGVSGKDYCPDCAKKLK